MKRAQKGFTLIEIMIVVAIIAILAAIAIPNFISYRKSAQKNSCVATLKALDSASEAFFIKNPAKASATGDAALKVSDLWDQSGEGKGLMKTEPKCPNAGTYTYNTTKQMWECSYTDADDSDYSHTRD